MGSHAQEDGVRFRLHRQGRRRMQALHRRIQDGPLRDRPLQVELLLLPRVPREEGARRHVRQRGQGVHRRGDHRGGRGNGCHRHGDHRRGPPPGHGSHDPYDTPPQGQVRQGAPHPSLHGDHRPREGPGPPGGGPGRDTLPSAGIRLDGPASGRPSPL